MSHSSARGMGNIKSDILDIKSSQGLEFILESRALLSCASRESHRYSRAVTFIKLQLLLRQRFLTRVLKSIDCCFSRASELKGEGEKLRK